MFASSIYIYIHFPVYHHVVVFICSGDHRLYNEYACALCERHTSEKDAVMRGSSFVSFRLSPP